jgi:serum/glucocorticoid-regulated kinase 2
LLVGLPPHYSQDANEIFQSIKQQEVAYPPDLSSDAIDLLQKLLIKTPKSRLQSFSDLKNLKYFQNIDWQAISSKSYPAPIKLDLYENNIHDEFL